MSDKNVHGNSTYREVYNSIAFYLCKLGANDEELGEAFKVDVRTIHNWKIAYADFFHSIKDGKIFFDTGLIENALKKKALGYEYEEIKEEFEGDKPVKKTITTKHSGPDTGSIALYLKNRASKDWKDKIEHTHIEQKSISDVLKDAANEE